MDHVDPTQPEPAQPEPAGAEPAQPEPAQPEPAAPELAPARVRRARAARARAAQGRRARAAQGRRARQLAEAAAAAAELEPEAVGSGQPGSGQPDESAVPVQLEPEAPEVAEPEKPEVPVAAPRRRLDGVLNSIVLVLVAAIIGLGAYFGYSVWQQRRLEENASPALRVIRALRQEVSRNPKDVMVRVRLGEALGSAGRFAEALEELQAAIKIDPEHTGAYLDLGIIANASGDKKASQNYFQKVVDLTEGQQFENVNNRREIALYNLGVLAVEEQRWEDAVANLKGAIRIRKDASDSYFNLAKAFVGLGDDDAALDQLENALAFDPNYAEAHFLAGQIYLKQEDKVTASYHFRKAADAAPEADPPAEALFALGTTEQWTAKAQEALKAGNVGAALDAVLVARNLDPMNAGAAKLHGRILEQQKELKGAATVYREASQRFPADIELKASAERLARATQKKK